MESKENTMITVEVDVNSTMNKVWDCWTRPEHITEWNFASDEWQCPSAFNDLRPGGHFNYRMEAKDMSAGFFYKGEYTKVIEHDSISFKLEDGRKVEVRFTGKEGSIKVRESFQPEGSNNDELQRAGWQLILENFKSYVEK